MIPAARLNEHRATLRLLEEDEEDALAERRHGFFADFFRGTCRERLSRRASAMPRSLQ
jgi:hypothetical protein